jgi:hypothetical protein
LPLVDHREIASRFHPPGSPKVLAGYFIFVGLGLAAGIRISGVFSYSRMSDAMISSCGW